MRLISTPTLLVALALTGCTGNSRYFGNPRPPSGQRLSYSIYTDVETLDPGRTAGGPDGYIILAMFEGLVAYHPQTLEPIAALATHYETNADQTQFTFYLRGHPNPRGIQLPNT